MKNLGRFVNLKSCFSLDLFQVVKIEMEDEKNYYYTDVNDRWCYTEKDSESILYIPPNKRIDWNYVDELTEKLESYENLSKV